MSHGDMQKGDLLIDFTNVQVADDGSFRTFGIYVPFRGRSICFNRT